MEIFQIIILGLVQAITEWLPLSSKTIDTVVYTKFFGGTAETVIPVLLYLHIGTLLAATIYFRKEIAELAGKFLAAPTNTAEHAQSRIGFIITALFFTGLVGIPLLLLEKFVLPTLKADAFFAVMGTGLIATGFLLSSQHKKKWRMSQSSTWKDGVLTGIMQGFSILPGVSRAGTTTTALIWRGFDAESSFHLSFLLAIPTVLGAEVLLWFVQAGSAAFPMSQGLMLSTSSLIFGYLTIGALLKAAQRINVASLAFAFGIAMLAFALLGIG